LHDLTSMGKDGKHYHVAFEKVHEADKALEAHIVKINPKADVEIQVIEKEKKKRERKMKIIF